MVHQLIAIQQKDIPKGNLIFGLNRNNNSEVLKKVFFLEDDDILNNNNYFLKVPILNYIYEPKIGINYHGISIIQKEGICYFIDNLQNYATSVLPNGVEAFYDFCKFALENQLCILHFGI